MRLNVPEYTLESPDEGPESAENGRDSYVIPGSIPTSSSARFPQKVPTGAYSF